METVAKEGIDPMQYIRFYNLRNYDRINASKAMQDVEEKAGVKYDDARRGYDQKYGQAGESEKYGPGHERPQENDDAFEKYQAAAQEVHGAAGEKTLDSVASCYVCISTCNSVLRHVLTYILFQMLGGEDIRNVSWSGDAQSELDAFVSEELCKSIQHISIPKTYADSFQTSTPNYLSQTIGRSYVDQPT